MADVTEQAVLARLKTVNDPDRGGNIVDLGMVSGLALRDGHVAFSIEVDRARAPKLEGLRQAAEKAVEAVHKLTEDVEIPTLQELGFQEAEIPMLADIAFKDPQTIGNPRDLSLHSYVKIYQRTFDLGKK